MTSIFLQYFIDKYPGFKKPMTASCADRLASLLYRRQVAHCPNKFEQVVHRQTHKLSIII